tara:strand:+ start:71 stop:406 length:336 start_codon:yes stop_codon:yes gene_type:complete
MSEENIVELDASSQPNKKLTENGLWDPCLIADVTLVVSQTIGCQQTVQSEDFHHLAWCSSDGKSDVIVEIRDGEAILLVNNDRWRGHREALTLEGVAARYGLKMGEYSDDD